MKSAYMVGIVLVAALAVFGTLPSARQETDQLKKFASYDELKNFIASNSDYFSTYQSLGGPMIREASAASPSPSPASPLLAADGSKISSSTNIQVEGVDEADIIKNDGKYIYAVSGEYVMIIDAYPADNMTVVSKINLNNTNINDIFVNGDKLAVFGNQYDYAIPAGAEIGIYPSYRGQSAFMNIYDISDRANPSLFRNISAGGSYVSSRMIGNYVYMIINEPVYNGDVIPLPALSGSAGFPDIYYFDVPGSSYNYINIVAADVNSGDAVNKAFLVPYTENVYVSQNHIYLTYTKWLDYRDFFDKLVNDVILPTFPELSGRIAEIRSYNISKNAQMMEIEQTVEDYIRSLDPEQAASVMRSAEQKMIELQNEIAKERERTVIHKISINGNDIAYSAQGSVPGRPLNQFSMDEHNGYFRIATTIDGGGPIIMTTRAIDVTVQSDSGSGASPSSGVSGPAVKTMPNIQGSTIAGDESGGEGSSDFEELNETVPDEFKDAKPMPNPDKPVSSDTMPSPIIEPPMPRSSSVNNVYALDAGLNIVGKVEDLAPGERIYSARFMGDRAYMVTFRQVDPLFVIDLSSPTQPTVLGQLKITGVSQYIHPVNSTHIIGVGKEATEQGLFQGLKMSLFDVSDVANPKEVSKFAIGDRGSDSSVLYDHKAFLFDKEKDLMVVPIMVSEIDRSKYPDPLPTWAYGEPKWQGAYAFSVKDGIKVLGKVTHAVNETKNYAGFYGGYSVERSLFIGDVLYTMSSKLLKANSLGTFDDISSLELPGYDYGPIEPLIEERENASGENISDFIV